MVDRVWSINDPIVLKHIFIYHIRKIWNLVSKNNLITYITVEAIERNRKWNTVRAKDSKNKIMIKIKLLLIHGVVK